ncbi:Transposase, partial [Anaerosphaera aminiphila DSM 21120]
LFLNAENKNIARKELEKWIERAKQSKIPEFKACIKALENWKEEILHYFESRFTNGRTEGFNNKIKVIKRVSYGYRNFETFKKRILWCCS